jgi:hypothetical protein
VKGPVRAPASASTYISSAVSPRPWHWACASHYCVLPLLPLPTACHSQPAAPWIGCPTDVAYDTVLNWCLVAACAPEDLSMAIWSRLRRVASQHLKISSVAHSSLDVAPVRNSAHPIFLVMKYDVTTSGDLHRSGLATASSRNDGSLVRRKRNRNS